MAWTKRIGIMLCQPLDDRNLMRNFKTTPYLLTQPKLDGVRCWIDWKEDSWLGERPWLGSRPWLTSSQGHWFNDSLPHIELALKEFAKITGEKKALDGELYCHGMPFEEILSRCKRELPCHPDFLSIQYHIFDYKSDKDMDIERQGWLIKAMVTFKNEVSEELREVLQYVPCKVVECPHEIEENLNEYVTNGYEGIIVRNPFAFYKEARPITILKWKPSKSDWYKIVRVEQAIGGKGQPNEGQGLCMVGSFLCEDKFGNQFSVGMGVGVDELMKKRWWDARNYLEGLFCRVTYQNLTKYGVPRFGKAVEVDTKNGEWQWW